MVVPSEVESVFGGALGDEIDAAANARAARRRAEQERAGAVQNLHVLIELRRHELPRRDAVKTVHGDIVAIERKAANDEELR